MVDCFCAKDKYAWRELDHKLASIARDMSACVQGIGDGSLGCLDMANWGLLSLLLRCLASADDALRGLAYEALALYAVTLERLNFRCLCCLLL